MNPYPVVDAFLPPVRLMLVVRSFVVRPFVWSYLRRRCLSSVALAVGPPVVHPCFSLAYPLLSFLGLSYGFFHPSSTVFGVANCF